MSTLIRFPDNPKSLLRRMRNRTVAEQLNELREYLALNEADSILDTLEEAIKNRDGEEARGE